MTFNRLTMDDLINIRRRDVKEKASVNIGDLIKVSIDKQDIIGIVLRIDESTMKLQTPNGEVKWISLYVIYEVLQYNNKKGDNNVNQKKSRPDKKS